MNRETAIANAYLNRVNQYTPWGNLTYTVDGFNPDGTPRFNQYVNLSQSGQNQLNNQNAIAEQLGGFAQEQIGRVQNQLGQDFNYNGAPGQVSSIDLSQLPGLATGVSIPDIQRYIQSGGNIQTGLGDTGQIQGSVNFGGAPGLPGVGDFSADRANVSNALYQQATSRLDPQFNQAESDLTARLANQGIAQGSEAYNREMDNFNRSRNDAYSQANWNAIQAGGAEQSRLFGLGMDARQQFVNEALQGGSFANNAQAQRFAQALSGGQFGNQAQQQQYDQNASNSAFYNAGAESLYQMGLGNAGLQNQARSQYYNELGNNAELSNAARQQWIQEQTYLRNLPLNDIAVLMGTAGGVQQPNFNPVQSVNQANTDLGGMVYDSYNANFNNWQAQQAQRQAAKGGMFSALGTGASMIAMSDRRMKKNIKRIGETASGIATYVFNYIGETIQRFGVMAQEVDHIPGAVLDVDGVLHVDYNKVWEL